MTRPLVYNQRFGNGGNTPITLRWTPDGYERQIVFWFTDAIYGIKAFDPFGRTLYRTKFFFKTQPDGVRYVTLVQVLDDGRSVMFGMSTAAHGLISR